MSLFKVEDLNVIFRSKPDIVEFIAGVKEKKVHAVNGVSFNVEKGEILSLVGESGSGKTTIGRSVLNLIDKQALTGKITFEGKDVQLDDKEAIRAFRQKAQMIFQDPYQSLNPRHSVYRIVAESLEVHNLYKEEGARLNKVKEALESAGLKPAEEFLNRYPHELSGGQRQRVAIAATIVLDPSFIVADEPVSMLDVSIRADILKLMVELKENKDISYLFITHDLSLAYAISDRIAILYLGRIMEIGPAVEVIKNARHPYSQALLEAMPSMQIRGNRKRNLLKGEVSDPSNLPPGCVFSLRCPHATQRCKSENPELRNINDRHQIACHLF